MMKFLKKNQKQVMAVFSVGLMIAFAVQGSLSKNAPARQPFGYIGKETITAGQVEAAKRQWQLLERIVMRSTQAQQQRAPLAIELVGQELAREIENKPIIFYLLRREAAQMGITVSRDEIQEYLVNRDLDQSEDVSDAELVPALENFLMVQNAYQQAISSIQVSAPAVQNVLSEAQQISVNVVEFKAADFLEQLPKWDAKTQGDAVDKLYNAYKDVLRGPKGTNDFEFGYRVPNQVQVQYLEVPIEAVKKQVRSGISEVDAVKFFLQNQDRFSTTEPTSGPATSKPVAATTQKSFKDYRQQAYDLLTDDLAQKQVSAMMADITTQMNGDFTEFKRAMGDNLAADATTLPTTAPTPPMTRFGVAYNSAEYLHALAAHEQEQFKLLPAVVEDLGLRSSADLAKGDISQATISGFTFGELYGKVRNPMLALQISRQAQFPTYVTNYIQPLMNESQVQTARNLQLQTPGLLEPSPELTNNKGDSFVFRVVQAVPSHPAPKEAVYEQALNDARLKAAYEMARGHAEKFLADHKAMYLQQAAAAESKTMHTTNYFNYNEQQMIEGYSLPDATVKSVFARAAYSLLTGSDKSSHPKGVIDLKPTATALAGEINGIRPEWDLRTFDANKIVARSQMIEEQLREYHLNWFNPDDVERRANFQPKNPEKKNPTPAPEQQLPSQNPITG